MKATPLVDSLLGKGASSLNVVAGLWLFISAWIFGSFDFPTAWNNWIAGALIVAFAWIRISSTSFRAWPAWINAALGVWVFASPWIWGYTGNETRFVNSVAVGACVFCLGLVSATAHPDSGHPPHEMHAPHIV